MKRKKRGVDMRERYEQTTGDEVRVDAVVSTVFVVQEFLIGGWDDKHYCNDLTGAGFMKAKESQNNDRKLRIIKRTETEC